MPKHKRYSILVYFLISVFIAPIYARYSKLDGNFELWFPLGFVAAIAYLSLFNRHHPSKLKASVMGLAVALVLIINQYYNF